MEKQSINYKGIPIRLSADFSTETLQARSVWQDIFKVLKGKNLQPRIHYPTKRSFEIEWKIKNLSNKQKLKEYSHTKPILKEILKGHSKLEEGEEELGWRKPHLESSHLNKDEDVKKKRERDVKITQCGEGK